MHAQFARLTRNEPRLGLRQFLAQAYDIKSIADYGLGTRYQYINLTAAGAAIDTAEQGRPLPYPHGEDDPKCGEPLYFLASCATL